MPSTYNGIGTRYCGKKNPESRPGVCQHCGRTATLSSYDTRLCFVILFIPVIPLERKRILDYCPHCTRHRVLSLKAWETLKADQLAKALAAVKASPDNPEESIRLHAALVAFGHSAEAEKLGTRMQDQFAQHAPTQAYLASVKDYLGRHTEALPLYQRALELDPELAAARIPVGLDLINQGKLEEAHQLLRFLEAPNGPQNAGALFALGSGYQKANRHREALELFTLLAGRFPQLGQDKSFRATVRKSEVATKTASSLLPRRRIRLGPTLGWATALVVALIVVFGSNYFISRNRTLHIASGLNQAVTIEVAGSGSVTLTRPGWRDIKLPEGAYRATVSGAVTQSVDFVLSADFFDRWFKKPVWVLNAGGSALLVVETTLYSASPMDGVGGFRFHFGEPFLFVPQVDYPFEPFPQQIQVDSRSKQLRKTRIDMFTAGPVPAFYGLASEGQLVEALNLAEWALRSHPEDTTLLLPYLGLAQANNQEAQSRALVDEAIQRRPIDIPWHRIYQQMRSGRSEWPGLVAEYDALLKADPENSALLYLRGRLCTSLRESAPLYQRAIDCSSTNAYAHFALGMSHQSTGDSSNALSLLTRAVQLMPHESQFAELLFETRLGQPDRTALETELRAKLQQDPTDYDGTWQLCQVLLARNQPQDAETVAAEYVRQVQTTLQESADEVSAGLRIRLAYAAGDFEAVLTNAAMQAPEADTYFRIRALTESGRVKDAAALIESDQAPFQDPFDTLAFSLACARAGDPTLAAAWRTQAITQLTEWRNDSAAAADMLERTAPVPLAEVLDLSLGARHKAVLLVALAERSPADAAAFRDLARQINVVREFPYHLVHALAGTAQPPATR